MRNLGRSGMTIIVAVVSSLIIYYRRATRTPFPAHRASLLLARMEAPR
jgi:hypothetical protein